MNIEENITKKTNLEANDSLSEFQKHSAQQNHGVYRVFYDFLKEIKPTRILEIGTALGGFTEFLAIARDDLGLTTEILSYDIAPKPWYSQIRERGVDLRVEDIFKPHFTGMKQEVIDFIQKPGITVVLCDGGNKKREFNLISNYIKPGDFIMGHDYSETEKLFKEQIKGKIWNWLELKYSDIQEACERNNLEDYNKDIFQSVVWVSKRKKYE